ncbi:Uncharacterized protein PECH_000602 [Penicillium ucsense]|uniref:Uncharacterized protein n=1 Tax=Penicillium ucsense TaxID=2839758 RepID=A0A8J8VY40_9EURO|nr:Uncharacterized protein PECM_000573 [Penicillium ucsense]KAF7733444.1 Uncharacterized protein PECH_000602 [Penicillium ucsense]
MAADTGKTRSSFASWQYPLSLLWSYEFRRQNDVLSTRLLGIKDQLKKSGLLNAVLSKVLNNLIVIIASMLTAMADVPGGGEHRLCHLRGLLLRTLAPLYEGDAVFWFGHEALISCIAQLENLHNLPGICSGDEVSEGAASLSSSLSGGSDSLSRSPSPGSSSGSQDGLLSGIPRPALAFNSHPGDGQLSPSEASSALALKLDTVMRQNGRSLQRYFDAVCAFRRYQIRLRQADDVKFIHEFLAGLDDHLLRRRLTCALGKTGWYWTWLAHEVLSILMEEQYTHQQQIARDQITANGAFIRPDGTCKYRVVTLPPITEEDLA